MTDQSGNHDRFAYYDREADIVWIPTGRPDDIVGEEQPWGLLAHERETGEVKALEIWSASEVLPEWLLANLPRPGKSRRPS
jgi:uncharacterized protein YuzE